MASKVVNLKSATLSPEEEAFFAAQAGGGGGGRRGATPAAAATPAPAAPTAQPQTAAAARCAADTGRPPRTRRGAAALPRVAAGRAADAAGGGGGGRGGAQTGVAGLTRQFTYAELASAQGGLTPLLFAVRQGHLEGATVLLDAGADVNAVSGADKTSPLLMAVINGHFDLADVPARARRESESRERERRDAALRRAQRPVGAARALSAAARLPAAEAVLSRSDEAADRQGRRRQRAPEQEGLVLRVQLPAVGRRRDRRDAVLARRLRERRRRDAPAGRARRRSRTSRR